MTATIPLNLGRDVQGLNANAPQFATVLYSATLAANTHSTINVPLDAPAYIMYVKVQPNGWIWVSHNGTAAVPAGGTFAANVSEMVDGATDEYKRLVYPKDVMDFITVNTTCDVSVSFYAVGYP